MISPEYFSVSRLEVPKASEPLYDDPETAELEVCTGAGAWTLVVSTGAGAGAWTLVVSGAGAGSGVEVVVGAGGGVDEDEVVDATRRSCRRGRRRLNRGRRRLNRGRLRDGGLGLGCAGGGAGWRLEKLARRTGGSWRWEEGLGGALVNENGHSFPDSLPLGDQVTLGVEVMVAVVAVGLGTGDASQNGGGSSNRYRLHDDCWLWGYIRR